LKNYPNPFNPQTTISFELKSEGKTKLEIFNVKGQKVKELVNEELGSGRHEVVWNGKSDSNKKVASGVYFYSLTHNDKSIVKKMLVMK
jgi:flagellar hook assembly protein FlgD